MALFGRSLQYSYTKMGQRFKVIIGEARVGGALMEVSFVLDQRFKVIIGEARIDGALMEV